MRLTLFYGALFLLSGACLLAVTYALVVHSTSAVVLDGQDGHLIGAADGAPDDGHHLLGIPEGLTADQVQAQADHMRTRAVRQHEAELRSLLTQSAIALAIMSVVSIVLGWIVAGRVLRPLRTITRSARQISATSLHARLALTGPDDELKELGDTFDELLGRLEASFTAQRQFIANASHELRSPLARQRTVVQVALSDPGAHADQLRLVCERVLSANAQQERLIEALLTLARSEAGLDHYEPFDLADITDHTIHTHRPEADRRGIRLDATLDSSPAAGAPRLVERLVTNLVDNALRHNAPSGTVHVTTSLSNGGAVLTVVNTGPVIPESEIDRLFQPFQRAGTARASRDSGLGLGLSIVKAIATAHGARLDAQPRPEGGMRTTVTFPPPT
ncbi:HAMP domain-containing histidine kinase [Nonomuraea sp. 3-1Str]|uniref:sensor histidine kinase n=1 Tax=Nonomuraea sp. 3-1Str TaxID=2929801 RepID=UPI0028612396|nr:HAMP domain-containing sensor histidine kinase [Nonomuraea sp. 3-1Str]MDR8412694.1 HAMP domain-containing histidine kinase [Nonomuraea sp. 3-1Str]